MWNAISYLYGYNTPTFYNETLFNINAQLAENGSDWYDYCENTGRESFFQLCSSGTATFFSEYCYPNSLEFAQEARHYKCNQGFASAFIYIPVDKDEDTKKTVGFISPDILNEWETVQYTEEEKELLRKVREYYKDSVDTFNAQTNYYDIEPQYDTLPLTGGKLNKNVALGAVGYLNSIRVGAGLNPLEYSEELSEAAQCKSTYTYYLSKNNYPNPNPHYPPQINGVDDDFYAQGGDVSYTYRTVYEKAYLNGATNEDASFNLQLGSSSIKMNPGITKKINASISPAEVMNKRINWKSANTNVAVVNECGEVTAVSLGNTDIIAVTEDGGITAICRVIVTDETIKDENNEENSVDTTESKTIDTVVKVSKNLKLAKSKISVIKGRRVKFKLPGSFLGKVTFNSKNNKIAAVTKKGIITTRKKGTTRIILKKGKKRAVLTITVK